MATEPLSTHVVTAAVHTRTGVHRWAAAPSALPLDDSPGSPWILVPPDVRRAFDAVTAAGTPLARTTFGPPLLGVKCGCNDAFLVVLDDADGPTADVACVRVADGHAPPRRGTVERDRLRPVVRGETLRRWAVGVAAHAAVGTRAHRVRRRPRAAEWIVWTHDDGGSGAPAPLAALPPHAARWLAPWRHRLAARSDTRGRFPWWALFRTESARVGQPRVVWADLGRTPRAAVLAAGDVTVPLNSCYVTPTRDVHDAFALATLLNSEIAAAWLGVVAEPARGGYRRYLGWTVGLLPLPADWMRARALLTPIGLRAAEGNAPDEEALTAAAAAAYGLPIAALAPLLAWRDA
jgi:hypothetical protein